MDGFLDGVFMQAFAILLVGGLSQVSHLFAFVFLKDRSSCKAVPERVLEVGLDLLLRLWGHCPVALIHDKSHAQVLDLPSIPLVLSFFKLAHHGRDFLNGRDHHALVIAPKALDQLMGIVRLVDVDDIIGRIREEGRSRLLVQVSAVDDKDGLLDGWDLQEIASYLVRGQGLT